jgi:Ca2+-binding RTX toxin-like protein
VDDTTPALKGNFAAFSYGAHYTVTSGGFTISQSFGAATVNITAFDADDDNDFDGDAGDVQDTITSVSVKDETGAFIIQNAVANTMAGGVGIVFEADGTVTVSGLLLNYQTLVGTADGFNRLEIEAVVEKWDFGGAVVSSVSAGEPVDMDFAVVVEDEDGDTASGTIELTVLPQQTADPGGETLTATEFGSNLVGGAGVDTLVGGAAADKLQGGGAADIISDGAGTDIIIGGDGADAITLTGDNETDTVIFDALSEIGDTVFGFDVDAPGNGDIIDLVDLLDTATDFTGTTLAEAQAEGYVQLLQNGGDTEVRIDLDGAANGVDFTTLVVTLDTILATDLADNIIVD